MGHLSLRLVALVLLASTGACVGLDGHVRAVSVSEGAIGGLAGGGCG